ncbi:hypothetical protein J416_15287 [Gracilibacillus halophilus YIM-C55.5]|uniref:MOSC domain-containing protein n=1 Tax=Gracilibacillus halophilus YIM-C55.5 TaxID=1308866 RepID=N4WQX3_9BACI|nr:MOSC domain-containing protein [Gracilibacillus halophilus]ENH95601.1 hypothetical protein J416_15287 [Gracilibacillus halophilus YIM-C55.5]
MEATIVSLNMGKPDTYVLADREVQTGFLKQSVNQPCYLSKTGFVEDGQADLKNHGGAEKAVLLYPYHHYSFWQERYHRTFDIPAFGENITIQGITEQDVCIGDVFQLGEAVIQVSQPRQPCYKISAVHQIKDMPQTVIETGYSGLYFRVLQEGIVTPTDRLIRIERSNHQVTSYEVFDCLFRDRKNKERMQQYVRLEGLAPNVVASFNKRLQKLG